MEYFEIKTYNATNVDSICVEDYNEALNKYRDLKNTYSLNMTNIIDKIEFNKVKENKKVNIFTKTFKQNNINENVCENQIYNNENVYEKEICNDKQLVGIEIPKSKNIANTIVESLYQLEELKKHHEITLKICERKREINLHKINFFNDKCVENVDDYKIKIFDDIYYWENERRNSKIELNNINNIEQSLGDININGIFNFHQDKILPKFNPDKYEKLVKFENDSDKQNLIKSNKNYCYYLVDDLKKEIYFYNLFDNGKSLQKLNKSIQQNINSTVKEVAFSDIKECPYKTIKEQAHHIRQFKDKYKYHTICKDKQIVYFSNKPIDITIL